MSIIANISSIVTIILFVFYILGRVFIIFIERNRIYEKIDIEISKSDNTFDKYKIVDEYLLDDDSDEYMIITPIEKSYNWIKIFKYNNYEKNKKVCEHIRKAVLNIGYSIKIKAQIAELTPQYVVRFQRSDYVVGEVMIAHNGRNGIQEEMIKCKHTLKSILYYLLK